MLSINNTAQAENKAAVMPNEFLAFALGGEEYGIDIQQVQELRGYETVTRIADKPAFIKGVINLRGVIVPIFDMRIKFSLGNACYDTTTVVIILNCTVGLVGMVVDRVSDVITLDDEQIRPAPTIGEDVNSSYLLGIGVVDERVLLLADVDRFISADPMDYQSSYSAQH